ncbi:MAG TPA: YceI family protein [Trebonia sp.]
MTLLDDGALAGDWTLDFAQSTVKLATKSVWGLVKVNGSFGDISGSGTITPDGKASGVLTVAAVSIDTANAKRDKHLRSKDFFHVEKHPEITYTATSVTTTGDSAMVEGTLTVLGNSRPLAVPATVTAADGTVTLDATVPVNRKDFGMGFNQLGMMGSDNTLTIHAVFTRA